MEDKQVLIKGASISKAALLTMTALLLGSIITNTCRGQAALVVLIFGDKVATEKFHTSIDMGLNLSRMPGFEDSKIKVGVNFGLGTFIKLNDKCALTPELKFLSRRGAKDVPPINAYPGMSDAQYNLVLNYIDLPVLFQYKLKPMLFVSAGAQVGFLTSAKQESIGTITESGNDVMLREEYQGKFNALHFCFPVEIGFSFPEVIPGQGIDIKLRYNFGINNVISDETYGSSRLSTFQAFLSFPYLKKQAK